MLTVVTEKGFAKLDTFTFTTDVAEEGAVIDYGDGNVEIVDNQTTFTHVYDTFGIYVVKIRKCNEAEPLVDNCLNVFVEPYVKDRILLIDPPLSSFSSKDSGLFQICLSSNCPPPLEVKLTLSGSDVLNKSEIDEDYLLPCIPKYYFADTDGEVIEDGLITFPTPSTIYANGIECGYRDSAQFSLFTDGESDVEICVELLNDCFDCRDLSVDYEECPLSGLEFNYGTGSGEIEMIDIDIL